MVFKGSSKLLVVLVVATYYVFQVASQAVLTTQAPLAPAAAVVPESQLPGVRADGAAAAAVSPSTAATIAVLRRHSRTQADVALKQARSWRPVLAPSAAAAAASNISTPGGGGSGGGAATLNPEAICGANSLVPDNSIPNCRIIIAFGSASFTCSAFKIGERLLGTAGHCIYQKPNGGWATAVDVYCTGASTCGGQRTTYATHITTTPTWMASPTNIPTAWDGAVIRTASVLPGATFPLGQYARPGTFTVRLTGYPAQSGDPGCETSAFAGACSQYSSTDSLTVLQGGGMYESPSLDLCSGHSGSGVSTADGSRYITAVVSGASFSPCANFFVPQINSGSVNQDCEKAEGGVSFACLAAKLPA